MQSLPTEVLHKQVSLFSFYLVFSGLLTQNAALPMFCSDIHYRSQPNQNSDQFYHFEIAILFVSILHRKLTQITAAGVEKEICNSVVQDDAHS